MNVLLALILLLVSNDPNICLFALPNFCARMHVEFLKYLQRKNSIFLTHVNLVETTSCSSIFDVLSQFQFLFKVPGSNSYGNLVAQG